MRGIPALCVLAAMASLTSGPLHAQPPAGGVAQAAEAPVVTAVEFVIDGVVVEDAALSALVDVQPGRPLLLADVRTSIRRLVHRGRFASIDVEQELAPAGLVVRIVATSLQRIVAYRFARSLPIPGGQLERLVRDRIGSGPTPDRIDDAVEAVVDALGERGYLQPALVPRIEPLDLTGNVRLAIDGEPGPRWVLGRLQLVGVEGAAEAGARAALGLSPGMPYDRLDLLQREERYLQQLRADGYYEAVIRTTPSPGAVAGTIDLAMDVTRGPRMSLSFTGDRLPPDVRRDLVPVEEEGTVDEDLLEDSRARIVRWLQERGHWRAAVSYDRRVTDGSIEVVFEVRSGRLYDTAGVVIGGQRALSEAEIRDLFRLRPGQPFAPSALAESVNAIVAAYRDRGFPGAHVEQALVDVSEPSLSPRARGRVEVRLRVVEGPEARVAAVHIDGAEALTAQTLLDSLSVRPDALFSAAAVVVDRETILRRYLDAGYRQARVEADLTAAEDGRAIDVGFSVTEGPQILVDRIIIVGNVRIAEDVIRRELQLLPGQPLGLSAVFESQRRLTALGLFRSIRITDVAQPGTVRHDVIVTVEEAPVTAVGYGVGLEGGQRLRSAAGLLDDQAPGGAGGAVETRFEFAPRGFFEVGRRNFLGKNRSVNLFLRGSLRPRDVPADPRLDGTGLALSEYRVLGTLREPRAFFETANLDLSAFTEQAIRSSFNFRRQAVRAELSRLMGTSTTVIGRYGFGRTELFNARIQPEDQLSVDRLFPQVRLSSVSTSVVRDTRDDPLDPQRGQFASLDGESAGRRIGSEVGFAKTYMQGFLYRRVPGSRVVVAGGARLGLAAGLPRAVSPRGPDGQPLLDGEGQPIVDVVRDLPASERFFAGGDSTVRGFALDRLGDTATLDRNGLPTGGNALLVFNSEVRIPVWRSMGAAVFFDAGNVFLRAADLDLARLRGAAGVGLRYQSPIGPIRVDVGLKTSRQTFLNGTREGRAALHITVGQAF